MQVRNKGRKESIDHVKLKVIRYIVLEFKLMARAGLINSE